MIIHSNDLDRHDDFVELVLTTDEIQAAIGVIEAAISGDGASEVRDLLHSALASMNFALQRAATANWRRQLAEELLDRARVGDIRSR